MDWELAAVFKSKLAVPGQEVEPMLEKVARREPLLAVPLKQEPTSDAPELTCLLESLGDGDGRTDPSTSVAGQ
jgi:hypothetical protein